MAGKDGNGLITYVHVPDERGVPAVFGPQDELPDWAIDKIGAHCFEGGKKPHKSHKDSDSDGDNDDKPASKPASKPAAKA